MTRPRRRQAWLAGFWSRALAVFVLCFAAPGGADVVHDVVALVTGSECCEGPCEDRAGDCCPGACAHCGCCAHPGGVPAAAGAVPIVPVLAELSYVAGSRGAYAPGYRAPPFRPPVG